MTVHLLPFSPFPYFPLWFLNSTSNQIDRTAQTLLDSHNLETGCSRIIRCPPVKVIFKEGQGNQIDQIKNGTQQSPGSHMFKEQDRSA